MGLRKINAELRDKYNIYKIDIWSQGLHNKQYMPSSAYFCATPVVEKNVYDVDHLLFNC